MHALDLQLNISDAAVPQSKGGHSIPHGAHDFGQYAPFLQPHASHRPHSPRTSHHASTAKVLHAIAPAASIIPEVGDSPHQITQHDAASPAVGAGLSQELQHITRDELADVLAELGNARQQISAAAQDDDRNLAAGAQPPLSDDMKDRWPAIMRAIHVHGRDRPTTAPSTQHSQGDGLVHTENEVKLFSFLQLSASVSTLSGAQARATATSQSRAAARLTVRTEMLTALAAKNQMWAKLHAEALAGTARQPKKCPCEYGPLCDRIAMTVADSGQEQLTHGLRAALADNLKHNLNDTTVRKVTREMTRTMTVSLVDSLSDRILREAGDPYVDMAMRALVHMNLSPLTHSLSAIISKSLSRHPQEDYFCWFCLKRELYCNLCEVSATNDHFADHYVRYYSNFYADYFTKFYAIEADVKELIKPSMPYVDFELAPEQVPNQATA